MKKQSWALIHDGLMFQLKSLDLKNTLEMPITTGADQINYGHPYIGLPFWLSIMELT